MWIKPLSTALTLVIITLILIIPKSELSIRNYVIAVKVEYTENEIVFTSTGSVVKISDGWVIGAAHVVNKSHINHISIIFPEDNNRELIATVYKTDTEYDLALIKVPGVTCPCAQIATNNPEKDTRVLSVGYPLGYTNNIQFVTEGTVQGIRKSDNTLVTSTNVIGGSSGGGLFVKEYGIYKLTGITRYYLTAPQDEDVRNMPVTWISDYAGVDMIKDFLIGTPVESMQVAVGIP